MSDDELTKKDAALESKDDGEIFNPFEDSEEETQSVDVDTSTTSTDDASLFVKADDTNNDAQSKDGNDVVEPIKKESEGAVDPITAANNQKENFEDDIFADVVTVSEPETSKGETPEEDVPEEENQSVKVDVVDLDGDDNGEDIPLSKNGSDAEVFTLDDAPAENSISDGDETLPMDKGIEIAEEINENVDESRDKEESESIPQESDKVDEPDIFFPASSDSVNEEEKKEVQEAMREETPPIEKVASLAPESLVVSDDDIVTLQEELVRIDSELIKSQEFMGTRGGVIEGLKATITKQEEAREVLNANLKPVLEREENVEKEVIAIEQEEKDATSHGERRSAEEKRVKKEAERRTIEEEKWKVGEQYEKKVREVEEFEAALATAEEEKATGHSRFDDLSKEKELKESMILLGEIQGGIRTSEITQSELGEKKEALKKQIQVIEEKEATLEKEKNELESQEKTAKNFDEKKDVEQKRHGVEERRAEVENMRWEAEDGLRAIEAEHEGVQEMVKISSEKEQSLQEEIKSIQSEEKK